MELDLPNDCDCEGCSQLTFAQVKKMIDDHHKHTMRIVDIQKKYDQRTEDAYDELKKFIFEKNKEIEYRIFDKYKLLDAFYSDYGTEYIHSEIYAVYLGRKKGEYVSCRFEKKDCNISKNEKSREFLENIKKDMLKFCDTVEVYSGIMIAGDTLDDNCFLKHMREKFLLTRNFEDDQGLVRVFRE